MLLPDDQSKVVIEMASKISERIAEEKVISWLNKHVSAGRQFMNYVNIKYCFQTLLNCFEATNIFILCINFIKLPEFSVTFLS